jgi:hypothetical protein
VPDTRTHRGPHPEDARLFSPEVLPALDDAVCDLCWLLSRGYASTGALKLVGDRYRLDARQRSAISRSACSDAALARRRANQVAPEQLRGQTLRLDGYNVLTTVEAALAGGVILAARDGTYRDLASMHGSFRKVVETLPSLELLGEVAAELGVGRCVWYLDRPVSNSGRLRSFMERLAAGRAWSWQVDLVPNPDSLLSVGPDVVASADSAILDRCQAWLNLAREAIDRRVPQAHVIRLDAARDTR